MISESNNFCRVFELPITYPNDFCFGGGHAVTFTMVDWFQPIPMEDIWENKVEPWSNYVPALKQFLLIKNYIKPDRTYLLITDFGESFLFDKT